MDGIFTWRRLDWNWLFFFIINLAKLYIFCDTLVIFNLIFKDLAEETFDKKH